MLPFPLVVLLTLAAGPDRTVPAGCREDFVICREDCTIDYGGSTTKYRQLSLCLQSCEKEQAECTTRHYSLRDTGYDKPVRDTEAPAARIETPRDGVRRGVEPPVRGGTPDNRVPLRCVAGTASRRARV